MFQLNGASHLAADVGAGQARQCRGRCLRSRELDDAVARVGLKAHKVDGAVRGEHVLQGIVRHWPLQCGVQPPLFCACCARRKGFRKRQLRCSLVAFGASTWRDELFRERSSVFSVYELIRSGRP